MSASEIPEMGSGRQAVKNIEFLADPTVGEVRVGAYEVIIGGLLPTVFSRLRRQYPCIALHVTQVGTVAQQYRELRERKVDLFLGRIPGSTEDDVAAEIVGSLVADAFRARGLKFPLRGVAFGTNRLHCALIAQGPFVSIFPNSMLRFGTSLPPLKVLPVELPIRPWPVGIMTLKSRTLSPVVRLFIDRVREVAKPLAKQLQ